MNGFDISNHQEGLNLDSITDPWDFAWMKATGGTGFVDKCCDGWVQWCRENGKRWGFYHFGDDGYGWNPEAEARFFLENTINYFGEGIPILDWEMTSMDADIDGINRFVRIVHDETGVWPLIYANPWRFNLGGVEPNCGRIIADYPNVLRPTLYYQLPEIPETDGLVAMWQYCSDGLVAGVENWNLDLDRFFGDEKAWDAYVRGDNAIADTGDGSSGVPDNAISTLENDQYKVTIERK